MKLLGLALLALYFCFSSCAIINAVELGFPVSTSTRYDSGYINYNLNNVQPRTGIVASAWSAGLLDDMQWVGVSSVSPQTWVGVRTQGRADQDQWVKTFKVIYSMDGVIWRPVDNGKVYTGNSDRNTIVDNTFDSPVRARAIRIIPVTYNKHISMRFEALISTSD